MIEALNLGNDIPQTVFFLFFSPSYYFDLCESHLDVSFEKISHYIQFINFLGFFFSELGSKRMSFESVSAQHG